MCSLCVSYTRTCWSHADVHPKPWELSPEHKETVFLSFFMTCLYDPFHLKKYNWHKIHHLLYFTDINTFEKRQTRWREICGADSTRIYFYIFHSLGENFQQPLVEYLPLHHKQGCFLMIQIIPALLFKWNILMDYAVSTFAALNTFE